MPVTATVVLDPATRSVKVSGSGGTAPYVADAYPTGRDTYRVRGTWTNVSGTYSTLDPEVPLNTATQYVVTDSLGVQGSTTLATVTSTVHVLSDATDPTLFIEPIVVAQPPNRWDGRTTWWNVLGRRDPFVSVAPLQLRSGDLVLRTDTPAERLALVKLLTPGTPLLLRSPIPANTDDVTMAVASVAEDLLLRDEPDGARHWSITYQAVTRELGPWGGSVTRTYAALLTEAATYAVLKATRATYNAVRLGTPPPVGG